MFWIGLLNDVAEQIAHRVSAFRGGEIETWLTGFLAYLPVEVGVSGFSSYPGSFLEGFNGRRNKILPRPRVSSMDVFHCQSLPSGRVFTSLLPMVISGRSSERESLQSALFYQAFFPAPGRRPRHTPLR